jgi:hypothetical protein
MSQTRVVASEPHDRAFRDVLPNFQARAKAALGQQQPRTAVDEHEGDPILGRSRINRQVRRPRLEDGKHADDQQRRPLHAQADDVVGPDIEPLELARQCCRLPVEFAIGETGIAMAQRNCVGCTLDLRCEPV